MDEQLKERVAMALGRIPSGLFVVSTLNEGVETSFLGSWVVQAGFDPPAVSVAVGMGRPALPFMETPGSMFAVSVIAHDERKKLGPFYKPVEPGPAALDGLDIERTPAGLAVVEGCLAWLECRTIASGESGDHVLIIGEVLEAGGRGGADPAVHVRTDGLGY